MLQCAASLSATAAGANSDGRHSSASSLRTCLATNGNLPQPSLVHSHSLCTLSCASCLCILCPCAPSYYYLSHLLSCTVYLNSLSLTLWLSQTAGAPLAGWLALCLSLAGLHSRSSAALSHDCVAANTAVVFRRSSVASDAADGC